MFLSLMKTSSTTDWIIFISKVWTKMYLGDRKAEFLILIRVFTSFVKGNNPELSTMGLIGSDCSQFKKTLAVEACRR